MRENAGESSSNVNGVDDGDSDGESDSTSLSLASDGVALSTRSWEGDRFNNMVELCKTSNEEAVSGPRQRRTVDYTQLYYVSTTSTDLLIFVIDGCSGGEFRFSSSVVSGNVWKGCWFARAR